eukprot:3618078-Rhodomonas_salina.5
MRCPLLISAIALPGGRYTANAARNKRANHRGHSLSAYAMPGYAMPGTGLEIVLRLHATACPVLIRAYGATKTQCWNSTILRAHGTDPLYDATTRSYAVPGTHLWVSGTDIEPYNALYRHAVSGYAMPSTDIRVSGTGIWVSGLYYAQYELGVGTRLAAYAGPTGSGTELAYGATRYWLMESLLR